MPSPNVIQLRQMLAEKFPRLRPYSDASGPPRDRWLTGLDLVDRPLQGGFFKGTLSEVITRGKSSGSSSLIHALIRRAAREGRIVTFIDGTDSLEVTQLEPEVLSRLLWVRTGSVEKALKAVDVVLRDPNLSLVLVDLAVNSEKELRRIPAPTWYRFQRLVETTSTVCIVFTPRHMVVPAQTRITLSSNFSLSALEQDSTEWLSGIKLKIPDAPTEERTQNIA